MAAVQARSYVYFSAFDDADQPNNLMYRVCQIQGAAYGVVYQECSTEDGASGAGVYMQVYDLKKNDWNRVVGVYRNGNWEGIQTYSMAFQSRLSFLECLNGVVAFTFNG